MPRGQARCVQRKSRLSCERSTKCFSTGEHCCLFRSQADRFAQLFEMLCVHFVTFHVSLDVASRERCLLESELRGACECRSRVGIESNIAECEDVDVLRQLQRGFDDEQSAFTLLSVELLDQRTHLYAAGPYDAGSFQTLLITLVLKRQFVRRHSHHTRLCVHFHTRLVQRVF